MYVRMCTCMRVRVECAHKARHVNLIRTYICMFRPFSSPDSPENGQHPIIISFPFFYVNEILFDAIHECF